MKGDSAPLDPRPLTSTFGREVLKGLRTNTTMNSEEILKIKNQDEKLQSKIQNVFQPRRVRISGISCHQTLRHEKKLSTDYADFRGLIDRIYMIDKIFLTLIGTDFHGFLYKIHDF